MPVRLFVLLTTVFVVTNLKYEEGPRLERCDETSAGE